jgi:hypothetical protein
MIHPAIKAAAAIPVVAYGWIASASAIYLAGTGKMDLFRFPFLQWALAAPWWWLNWTMTGWVIASAAAPTLLLLVCGFGLARHAWRTRGNAPPIYGDTGWADHAAMRAGGLQLRERL